MESIKLSRSGFIHNGLALNGCVSRRELIGFFVESIHSILPKIEQLRIATREQVDIDTLADRIEAQACAACVDRLRPLRDPKRKTGL